MFTLTKINLLWDKVKSLTAQVNTMAKIPRGSVVVGLMSGAATIPEAARNEIGDAFKKNIPCFIVFESSGVFKNMYRVTQCYYDITNGALTEIVAIQMKKDAVGHYYIDAKANNSWSATVTSVDEPSGTSLDYSTTEQDTGTKWIDGKTIYQKTIYNAGGTSLPAAATFDHGIENLARVVSCDAIVTDAGESGFTPYEMPLARIPTTGTDTIAIQGISPTQIVVRNASAYGTRLIDWRFTLKYTKSETQATKKTKKVKEED